jgi:hypothetical protein
LRRDFEQKISADFLKEKGNSSVYNAEGEVAVEWRIAAKFAKHGRISFDFL